jgi:hypothetical protein
MGIGIGIVIGIGIGVGLVWSVGQVWVKLW